MIDVTEQMEHLGKLARRDPGKRFTGLWEDMTSRAWLIEAWVAIRTNRGSRTAGIDHETGDDIDAERIRRLSERLRTGAYRPKPVRRVYIPKGNGKLRPLGIPTVEDRLVQQALRMVLEPIFEADFLGCSHGFRRGRSTHTALRQVATAYPRTSWVVEGDIKGCFDNIPHGPLMRAVRRRIADEKVLSLVWRFLEAGYLEDWVYHRTYSGTPQGGIISPLLCNVFLHQLDEFMTTELEANRPLSAADSRARKSKEYDRIRSRIQVRIRRLAETRGPERRAMVEEIRQLRKELRRTPTIAARHPCKVGYVRYADDFVVLVNGPKEEAAAIKARVGEKLASMGLTLSEEKTKLTHWRDPISFLGYHIHGKLRDRGVQIRAILTIPAAKIGKVRDGIRKVCGWHHIPEVDAMCQLGALFRGWTNYYRYASAPQTEFSTLSYFAWWEFAHYLAKRRKLGIAQLLRRAKAAGQLRVVRKNGRRVQTFVCAVGEKQVVLDIVPPKTVSILGSLVPKDAGADAEPEALNAWAVGRSYATRMTATARAGGACERCGVNPVSQVHHSSAMKGRSHRGQVASDAAQRETAVALCDACHRRAHATTG
jgi:group II intron reverse transcriptase/maturase